MLAVAQVQVAEPWASVEEVALHLVVEKDSVYRWIEAKRLPAHRLGELWKFRFSEVDDWVRADGANNVSARARPVRRVATRGKK